MTASGQSRRLEEVPATSGLAPESGHRGAAITTVLARVLRRNGAGHAGQVNVEKEARCAVPDAASEQRLG
jgi:hypothetical protein